MAGGLPEANKNVIYVPPENRYLGVPVTEWVLFVPAENRRIEVQRVIRQ